MKSVYFLVAAISIGVLFWVVPLPFGIFNELIGWGTTSIISIFLYAMVVLTLLSMSLYYSTNGDKK